MLVLTGVRDTLYATGVAKTYENIRNKTIFEYLSEK